MLSMGEPPDPREARSEGKLHDPPIQDNKSYLWLWMARITPALCAGGRPW
jgi:hypothetical protein